MSGLAELWHSLRSQRGRAVSTLLGITWGTMAVVLLLAFGFGLQAEFEERGRGLGAGIAICNGSNTTLPWAGLPPGRRVRLRRSDVDALREIPELAEVSAESYRNADLRRGGQALRATINGVEPSYQQLRNMQVVPGGRFLNAQDLDQARRVVFLGDRIARRLFGPTDPVGQRLTLDGTPLTVVGVMQAKKQSSDYGGLDKDRCCIPISTYQQVFGQDYVGMFVLRARDPRQQDLVLRKTREILARRRQFDPGDHQALSIWDTSEEARMIGFIFLALNLMMGVSGLLTLIVGGVGVGNLMFLMVRQRRREIGIQMALGARPAAVMRGLLAECGVLVALGGACGVGLSWVILQVVQGLGLDQQIGTPSLSPLVMIITVSVLGSIALLAGYFPARRAARIDPVLALAE